MVRVLAEDCETETSLEGIDPVLKKVGELMKSSRIIVISPYSRLNVYLEHKIPEIIRGADVDVLERTDRTVQPYVDVATRERDKQAPYLIIDFEQIVGREPSKEVIAEHRRMQIFSLLGNYLGGLSKRFAGIEGKEEFPFEIGSRGDISKEQAEGLVELIKEDFATYFGEKDVPGILNKERDFAADEFVEEIVDFSGYRDFANKKDSIYVIPRINFSVELIARSAQAYDKEGNFLPNKVKVEDYFEQIEKDLREIESGKKGWKLFSHSLFEIAKP